MIQVIIAAPFPDRLTGSKGQPIGETQEKGPHMEVFTVRSGSSLFYSCRTYSVSKTAGPSPAVLVVGFSDSLVMDVDIPVAFGAFLRMSKKNMWEATRCLKFGYKGLHVMSILFLHGIQNRLTDWPNEANRYGDDEKKTHTKRGLTCNPL